MSWRSRSRRRRIKKSASPCRDIPREAVLRVAYDRVFATRVGAKAAELILKEEYGYMVAHEERRDDKGSAGRSGGQTENSGSEVQHYQRSKDDRYQLRR